MNRKKKWKNLLQQGSFLKTNSNQKSYWTRKDAELKPRGICNDCCFSGANEELAKCHSWSIPSDSLLKLLCCLAFIPCRKRVEERTALSNVSQFCASDVGCLSLGIWLSAGQGWWSDQGLGSDPPVTPLALAGILRCQHSSSIALPPLHTLPDVGALCLHGASSRYSLLI